MEIVTTKIQNGSHSTNLHRTGTGKQPTILFLHGSGPGATAFSNWQYALPALANEYDCLAPDLDTIPSFV